MEKMTTTLNLDEISSIEDTYKYSALLFDSDILRFKFDVQQFEPFCIYAIEFVDLLPLYNEHYYKYSGAFKRLKNIRFEVVKIQTYEQTFLMFLVNNEKDLNLLKGLNQMKSFKYKANFTKNERNLIYKLKNYSFSTPNSYWFIDNDIEIEEIKQQITVKLTTLKYLKKIVNFNKYVKFYHRDLLSEERTEKIDYIFRLQEELHNQEAYLQTLIDKKSQYYYGSSEKVKTVIDDYNLYQYCIE